MQQVVVPPSPNWYGAHTADWAPHLGLYAYAAQNTIAVLNTRAKAVRTLLAGHTNRVTAVAFGGGAAPGAPADSNGVAPTSLPPLLVSAATDRSLRIWNVSTMQRQRALYKRPVEVSALAVTSDGATALIGDKAGSLFSWDLRDPASKPRKLAGCKQAAAVTCLAAAPAGSSSGGSHSSTSAGTSSLVLAGCADGTVLLLDWLRDCVVQRLERHIQQLQCVRWFAAPDPTVAAAEVAVAAARAAAAVEVAVTPAQVPGSSGVAKEQAAGSEEAQPLATHDQQHQHQHQQQEQSNPGCAAEDALLPPSPPGLQVADAGDAPPPPPPECAAVMPAAPEPVPAPAWEVMLSSGADGVLRLYSLATPPSQSSSNNGSIQPRLVAILRLPKPHGGLTSSQTSKLWFTAAVVPPPPPVLASPKPAAAAVAPERQQAWLVTTSHGGSLLAWKVPLPASASEAPVPAPVSAPVPEPAAAGKGSVADSWWRSPERVACCTGGGGAVDAVVGPCKVPVHQGRTVFTLHAASLLVAAVPPAVPPASPAAACDNGCGTGAAEVEHRQSVQPLLQLVSSSMDRSVLLAQLPHPGAAPQVAPATAEVPEGSWRRDAAANSAADTAWRQAEVVWRLTGLGGHVYGLSLLVPPEPLYQPTRALQQGGGKPELEQLPSEVEAQQAATAAAAGGEDASDVPPPPPPPLPPGEATALAEQQQPAQEAGQQAEGQRRPYLLAIACGDKTIRVQPLAPTAAARRSAEQQRQQQLVLWQHIPEKVMAVAWQPLLLPEQEMAASPVLSADSSAAAAATAAAPAAAAMAFGCEDGSLGLMLPSREQSLLLPIKHQGSVLDVKWAPPVAAGVAAEAAVQLYSLSADGVLLLWGALLLPLSDLFPSSATRHGSSSSISSWDPAGGKFATALANPLDVGARLGAAMAAAAAAPTVGMTPKAAGMFSAGQQRQWLTAFALSPPGATAGIAGAFGSGYLLSVAAKGGTLAVVQAAPAAVAGEVSLRVLWASCDSTSSSTGVMDTISHLCFSPDGQQLAAAGELGLLSLYPWATEAGMLPEPEHPNNGGTEPPPAARVNFQLGSAITSLAWVAGSSGSSSSSGIDERSSGSGGERAPGRCGSGMLAAALLSGGIQLLDVHPGVADCSSSSSGGSSGGALLPTALLRGHSGLVRCLTWLPQEASSPSAKDVPENQQAAAAVLSGSLQQPERPQQPASAEQEALGEAQEQQQQRRRQQRQQAEQEAVPATQVDERQEQHPQHKLFLLSGAEDQSVRLWDIRRQLQVWQERQQAAALAAAVTVVGSPLSEPAAAAEQAPAAPAAGAVAAAAGKQQQQQQPDQVPLLLAAPYPVEPGAQDGAPAAAGCGATLPGTTKPVGVDVTTGALAGRPGPIAGPASSSTTAVAGATAAPTASKRKAAGNLLSSRPILPAASIPDADRKQQQEAQRVCLQLAGQLLQGQAAVPQQSCRDEAAAETGEGGGMPPPPPPSPPPNPAAALLLDCAADPLTASLVLQQQVAKLGADASSAGSLATRLLMAQRAAAAALFRGDVAAAVQLLLDHDALTADFVSMSAAAGPAAWRAVTLAYAARLEHQQQEPHLAALHLLATQEVEGAVQVYRRAGLLREALALASARFLPGHPLLLELHATYATQLSSKGQHEQEAAHHAVAGQWAAAARSLAGRHTAAAAAAAAEVCHRALSQQGEVLTAPEHGKLHKQLQACEQLLVELAAAEGVDVAAVAAEAAMAMDCVKMPPAAASDAPAAAPSTGTGGGGSAAGLPGLSDDLVHRTGSSPPDTGQAPSSSGSGSRSIRRREGCYAYSHQALLELSGGAEQLGPVAQAALRLQLPQELLRDSEPSS